MQPDLFTAPVPRATHRWVPDTSRAAHREAVASGRLSSRSEEVLALVVARPGLTSAELAGADASLAWVLHIRRGLSDLRKSGVVDKGEDRRCQVSRRECNTWKAATR